MEVKDFVDMMKVCDVIPRADVANTGVATPAHQMGLVNRGPDGRSQLGAWHRRQS